MALGSVYDQGIAEPIIIITRGVPKDGPGRALANPNVGCAMLMKIKTLLIEHSNQG